MNKEVYPVNAPTLAEEKPKQPAHTKKQIISLNGLRAISILIVIGAHLRIHNFFPETNKALKYFGFMFFNGQLGVNVFFVISGFLITTLLIRERERSGTISLKNFYARRAFRIFPAYYFLLSVYFVLQILGYMHFKPVEWLVNVTYTKQFFPSGDDFAGHLWTLSVEEVFYLVWPFIFMKSGKYSVRIILVLIGCVVVGRVINFDYTYPRLTNTIFTTGDSLLIGCLFAIKRDQIEAWIVKRGKWMYALFPGVILCVMVYNYFYHLDSPNGGYRNAFWLAQVVLPVLYSLIGSLGLITNLLIGTIIIYSIRVATLWSRFLNLSVMDYIGRLSYSIYLWQQLFTQDHPFLHQFPLILILVFIFATACFSHYIIEKPFLRLKERFEGIK
jgi:peptidoglycan/LPS O-acetylase OafA/YrhL